MSIYNPIAHRDASDTIKGFVYQVDITISRWLKLRNNEAIELERGEDLDIIRLDTDENTILRELEQVKYREHSISLNQEPAFEALLNFFTHRAQNPDQRLYYRFVTNANITIERPSIISSRKSAIEAWTELSQAEIVSETDERLIKIQKFLIKKLKSRERSSLQAGIDISGFRAHIEDPALLLAFIRDFEWSVCNKDAYSITGQIMREIIRLGFATDKVSVEQLYEKLFVFVFRLLTQKGLKRLDKTMLREQVAAAPLVGRDKRIYDTFKEIETRLRSLELQTNENSAAIEEVEQKLDGQSGRPAKTARNKLLEGLEKRYERRKQTKMDAEVNLWMDPNIEYTSIGISEDFASQSLIESHSSGPAGGSRQLIEEYCNNLYNILILGAPGAGKSALLVEFGLVMITKAKRDIHYPLPVILNLATWRSHYKSFPEWLEVNLVKSIGAFGTSVSYAKELVRQNNLALLLDGLDEVPDEDRASCMDKLWDYCWESRLKKTGIGKYPQLIICSRTKEYLAIAAPAPVFASISIEPMNEAYLSRQLTGMDETNPARNKLLKRIEKDPTILSKLTTVFDVHLALKLLKDHDLISFDREYLLSEYCKRQIGKVKGFTPERIAHYLGVTGEMLELNQLVTFELVDVTPVWIGQPAREFGLNWIQTEESYKTTLIVCRMLFLCCWIFMMACIPTFNMTEYSVRLFVSLSLGIIIAVGLGIINWRSYTEAPVAEIRKFSFREFRFKIFFKYFRQHFIPSFFLVFIPGILIGLIGGIVDGREYYTFTLDGIVELLISVLNRFLNAYAILPIELTYVLWCLNGIISIVYALLSIRKEKHANSRKILWKIISRFFGMIYLITIWVQFIVSLAYAPSQGPYPQVFKDLYLGMFCGLFFGAILGIVTGTFNGIVKTLFVASRSPMIEKPYKRFTSTFIFDFLKLSLPFTIITFSIMPFSGLPSNIEIFKKLLIPQLTIIMICIYTSPLFRHIVVRLILASQGKIPIRYATFLNRVSNVGLMEKDGGQWRFRHQMIQEYFTLQSLEKPTRPFIDFIEVGRLTTKLLLLIIMIYLDYEVFHDRVWLNDTIQITKQVILYYICLKISYVLKTAIIAVYPLDIYTNVGRLKIGIDKDKMLDYFAFLTLGECTIYGLIHGFKPYGPYFFNAILLLLPFIPVVWLMKRTYYTRKSDWGNY